MPNQVKENFKKPSKSLYQHGLIIILFIEELSKRNECVEVSLAKINLVNNMVKWWKRTKLRIMEEILKRLSMNT